MIFYTKRLSLMTFLYENIVDNNAAIRNDHIFCWLFCKKRSSSRSSLRKISLNIDVGFSIRRDHSSLEFSVGKVLIDDFVASFLYVLYIIFLSLVYNTNLLYYQCHQNSILPTSTFLFFAAFYLKWYLIMSYEKNDLL